MIEKKFCESCGQEIPQEMLESYEKNILKNKEKDKKYNELEAKLKNTEKDKDDAVNKALLERDEKHKLSLELKDKEHQKKLEQIRKKQEAATVGTGYIASELAGEGLEETIKEYLIKWYPNFDIEDIAKGKRGGDHIITVKHNNNKIGKIKIE